MTDISQGHKLPSPGYLSRCYFTILICVVVVIASALPYFAMFESAYVPVNPAYSWTKWLMFGILGIILVISAVFWVSQETLSFGAELEWKISFGTRHKLLPAITLSLIVALGALCAVSDGSLRSPFSQYLVAVSSIAIIFAESKWSRLGIITLCIVSFGVASYWYFAPVEPVAGDALPGLREFNIAIVVLTVGVAATAAWRVKRL